MNKKWKILFLWVLPEPFLHMWCTLFYLPALCASSSSHGLSIFQTALQTTWTLTWTTVNEQPLAIMTKINFVFYRLLTSKNCSHGNTSKCWIILLVNFIEFLRVNSLCGMKPLTFALQEFGHELIKGSWIREESSHLVEVVWRHHDVLRVPHDIDHLWQLQIFMNRKREEIWTQRSRENLPVFFFFI